MEHTFNNNLQKEPVFTWWINYLKKKKERVIKKLKSEFWKKTYKYGIRLPQSMKEVKEIDVENKNTFLMDSVKLEMKNNRWAFDEYNNNPEKLESYQEVTAHIIFDIGLWENFLRKARFVGDGYKADVPSYVTYSSLVSRDFAALHELELLDDNIQNAFLTAPCKEKIWIRAELEFGYDQGKVFIISKVLYGLKASSSSFRNYIAETWDEMGFKSNYSDGDIWLRSGTKVDGEQHYEYVMYYVYDILAVSTDPKAVLNELKGSNIKFKHKKIEQSEIYLGVRLEEKQFGEIKCWTQTSLDYIKAALKKLKEVLKDPPWKL